MSIVLLPQPKIMRTHSGHFRLPLSGTIDISDDIFIPCAREAESLFARSLVQSNVQNTSHTIRIADGNGIKPGGYRLTIDHSGITLEAGSAASAFSGAQTLLQINAQCPDRRLPLLRIDDWPDFRDRGVYYDITRGRVPKLESLIRQIELLSRFKINQYQLYIEHVFSFRSHPEIGKGASPLTGDDIMKLDSHCRERNIELVPSLASFGHLSTILKHPRYRHLAEDWGIGRYLSPEAANLKAWQRRIAWALSPANPEVYKFLDSLFAEFLPLFSSDRFNVCCDETWDLGLGQSFELCKKLGKGRVYLNHIMKLRDLAAKYGKRIMFWGDIIRNHPDLIRDIPKDITVLDWGYSFNRDFGSIRNFKKAGLEFCACPGTSSWVSLFPRLHEAMANIHGFAEAGHKNRARGLLNTDWGDGGHYNFMEYSWHGYLFGAEQAWNVNADRKTFTYRFCKLLLNIDDHAFADAIEQLGEVAHIQYGSYYQSIWQHIFFARSKDVIFQPAKEAALLCRNGRISRIQNMTLDSKVGRESNERLQTIRNIIAAKVNRRGCDPHRILPYWLFAVDTLLHATKKLAALGKGGNDSPAIRRKLKAEMTGLMKRFTKLWRDRNRPSEIRATLKRYHATIHSLGRKV